MDLDAFDQDPLAQSAAEIVALMNSLSSVNADRRNLERELELEKSRRERDRAVSQREVRHASRHHDPPFVHRRSKVRFKFSI